MAPARATVKKGSSSSSIFATIKSSWLRILLCSKKCKRKLKLKLKPKFRNRQEKKVKVKEVKKEKEEEVISPLVEKIKEVKKEKEEEVISPLVEKYWIQRYDLFSKYDNGIKMDEEGWYSVTPEQVAAKQAERCRGKVVIDCFSGVAGNAIQFARLSNYVIAIDIDPLKVELAYNNAKIYGVEKYIDFVVGDFFQLAPSLKADVIFLSPPWGGPSYVKNNNFTLDFLKPKDGYSLFQIAQTITPNIIMFLPRNVDLQQVQELPWLSSPPLNVEIEENYVNHRKKGITVYFGDIAFRRTTLMN